MYFFVAVPFTAVATSVTKTSIDAVILTDGSTDGTTTTGSGKAGAGTCGDNGENDGRIRVDAIVVLVVAIAPMLR